MDEVCLLALLWSGDMRGDEGIHEGLEVWSPPLGKTFSNFPVSCLLTFAQAAHWCEALIEASLETVDFIIFRPQVVPRKLEEGIRNLEHQDMRVVVFMTNEDAFAGAAHAMLKVVLLQSLETSDDGWVLLGLRLLNSKGIIGQRVKRDLLRLIGVEGQGDGWRMTRLERGRGNGRHFVGWARLTIGDEWF
jgi:hypothetical protein